MESPTIVIIGATSLIAEHCARIWLRDYAPGKLVLVGRNEEKIAGVASALSGISATAQIQTRTTAFLDAGAISLLAEDICTESMPDIVLIAHGYLPDQQAAQHDLAVARDALEVNAVSPVLFAEAFVRHMVETSGKVGVISSIAGDRGRKSNYFYGAAKALVSHYVQGLQHRLSGGSLSVSLIKPGPTSTPKTVAMHTKGLKLAPVETVAKDIVDGISAGKAVIYTPGKWCLIMLILRHVPKFLFNKLNI